MAARRAAVRRRDGGEPGRRRARRWCSPCSLRPGALGRGAAAPRPVAGGAGLRVPAEPAGPTTTRASSREADRALLRRRRAQDLGLLRASSPPRTTGCRRTTSRSSPADRAHRTSPTNIGLALLATLAAHDLGYLDLATLRRAARAHARRRSRRSSATRATCSTGTTRARSRRLSPRYVSTVDSGNLAAAADGAHRALRAGAARRRARGAARHADADASPNGARTGARHRFRLLYDARRRLFSIGYRLPDADGPGRLDASFYDLLASEARLASFIAIAKGDVPQRHWFHLGRPSPASTACRRCSRGARRCSST